MLSLALKKQSVPQKKQEHRLRRVTVIEKQHQHYRAEKKALLGQVSLQLFRC
jgi:hypothetical protein